MRCTERPSVEPRLFAGALLASSGLQLVELLLPRVPIVPWLRPGFSWIVILPFLLDFGTAPALALFLARNLLSMAFGGQPASTFLISSAAGSAAILASGPLLRLLVRRGLLARLGASVVLAACFNALQLLLVAEILVGSTGYFHQIGPLLLWSALSGALVAWLSLPLGDGRGWTIVASLAPSGEEGALPEGSARASIVAASAMTASLVLPSAWQQGAFLAFALAWGRRDVVRAVLHTWPFLPYLAWFHLRGTPGELVLGDWITREGLLRMTEQSLRLWSFTAFGRILSSRLPWRALIRFRSSWTRGFALALPAMPSLFPAALGSARDWWRTGRGSGLAGLLERFAARLARAEG